MKYISGGYYIISPLTRAEYMDKTILPETIISVSDCLCDFHPEIDNCGEVQIKVNRIIQRN
ncbi:hypothetical protein [Litchfieldia salsa]|uniref:Uncharacterized protein n=1 Tax=Litchfieldia salsa TaxID=930152 RepID=A0A1H0SNF6_9BACI|nr:hypothetical protein [Litchfieldia salsa]SDP43362.1 hypothetical protein SAMN05216565_10339 [Litchfieldia salsa]